MTQHETPKLEELEHRLIPLNVNDHVEKKQGLSYLSWAWAWQEALRHDPSAVFHVQTFDGKPYMDVNGTGMVWVTVTFGQRSRTCFLPVMDHRNKPVPNPDAFQVNTAIMRCMTKCLAMFGLGLYIYAGEDLPPGDGGEAPKADAPQDNSFELGPSLTEPVTNQETKNLQLFADSIVQFINISKSEKDLRSYWKNNQTTIDKLKVHLPAEYAKIVEKFSEAKTQLKAKEQANG